MLKYREFYENDFVVFPLHKIINGKCSCGCSSGGKHPLHKNWQNTHPTEPIDSEYTTGYGILVTNGLLVIDVDARNGGVESYAKLVETIPEIAGCGLIVETGSGNGSKHLFFKTSAKKSLKAKLDGYPGIDFKSSGFVVGAGSLHASGNTYNIVVGAPGDVGEAPAKLVDLLSRDEYVSIFSASDSSCYLSKDEIVEALSFINQDTSVGGVHYDKWIEYGMALHHEFGDEGFKIWDDWSRKSKKYNRKVMIPKWKSFTNDKSDLITINTLLYDARLSGWTDEEIDFPVIESSRTLSASGFPLPINIDIKLPPGFAGEVVEYINSQSIYPRKTLSTASALWALGNVMSMRYEFQNYGLNLYAFGVAESATGKEKILRATREILRAADMTKALYTDIKSSVEMNKNLVEHQACFYLIDEVTQLFRKLNNASKSGSSSYLEGITKELLEIYTKSVGYKDGRGDDKRDAKAMIAKQIKALEAAQRSEGEDHQLKIDRLKLDLRAVDDGMKNPFVSLLGFSTPEGFNSIASYENVLSGLVGRCIIAYEYNDNPKAWRLNNDIRPMSEDLEDRIAFLRCGGYSNEYKIQQTGEREKVPISPDAEKSLVEYQSWAINHFVDQEKQNLGFASLVRRSAGEMVGKVAAIIGGADGRIEKSHIEWAIAYTMADLKEKKRIVNSSHNDLFVSLSNKIVGYIDENEGEYEKSIIDKCTRHNTNKIIKKDTVIACLDKMIAHGSIKRDGKRIKKIIK